MSRDIIISDIEGAKTSFCAALTDPSISFEKEAGFAIQLLTNNDYALGIALKNRQSVVNAVVNVGAIGISLNPAKKQAYLVPRDGKICLDISYIGLMDLAMATGSIKWAQAAIVYANDTFEIEGFDRAPTHRFNVFSKDRGVIVGAYVVVKTADNDYLTHTMTIDEIYKIRDRSAGWKSGKSTPWKTDEGEMVKKTVVKQGSKYWPHTDRLKGAIQYLNTDGEQGNAAEIEVTNSVKQTRSPAAAAAQNQTVDVADFESNHLDTMREAALNGNDALAKAFESLPVGLYKKAFWAKHGASLKEAAAKVQVIDSAPVVDPETGEVKA
jgi:recombination protein RecT